MPMTSLFVAAHRFAQLASDTVRRCVAAGAIAACLAAPVSGQYVMIPDVASPSLTGLTPPFPAGSQRVMLFSSTDGSLVDADFIPQATSPYTFSGPRRALQVGNEIWVSDGAQIICFTAVFNNSNPNPANWSRPTWIRTISGGISLVRDMVRIGDRVYVLNTGTTNGAPGTAVLVYQIDGTFVEWFPLVMTDIPLSVENFNGQLLISAFLSNAAGYYLYTTTGFGGMLVDNTAVFTANGSLTNNQIRVFPSGPGGAQEMWVATTGAFRNSGVRRLDANGVELAWYPTAYGCTGLYRLGDGSILFTDRASIQSSTVGSVKKFAPGTPPAAPIMLHKETVTLTGTTGEYRFGYNGYISAWKTYGGGTNFGSLIALELDPSLRSNSSGCCGALGPTNTSVVATFLPAAAPGHLTIETQNGDLVGTVTETQVGSHNILTMHASDAARSIGPMYISEFTPTAPGPTNPYASGSATTSVNQAGVLAGTSTTLTVNVTPGAVPTSTGLVVTANLSAFGGSSAQALTNTTGNTFTHTLSIPAAQAGGNSIIPLSVTDAQSRSGGGSIALTVIGAAPAGAAVETEPNDNKTAAQPIALTPGKVIWGTTTGATLTNNSSVGSADTYLVTTPAASPAIYVHTINLTTPGYNGSPGLTGTIRGLNQTTAGAIGTTDTAMSTSSLGATNPGYMVQWYGFGKQEKLHYRVTGNTSPTTGAEYLATYQTSKVDPIVVPEILPPGQVTFTPTGDNNSKFAICLFDSNLNIVANSNYASATAAGGSATRTLSAGTYYLAISDVSVATNLAASSDSDFKAFPVFDTFGSTPSAVMNGQYVNSTVPTRLAMKIVHGVGETYLAPLGSMTKSAAFQILWYKVYVGDPAAPQVDGAANPTPAMAGTSTQLDATVVPATDSTGISVTANLAALGGSSSQPMSLLAGNSYTLALNVPASQPAGFYTIPVTVADAQSRSSVGSISLRVIPAPAPGCVVETEPNNELASMNPAALSAGQCVYGTTTGAIVSADAQVTRDYFFITTPVSAPGIYRHRMTITTSGVAGHTGTLRGRQQVNGFPNPSLDFEFQKSSDQSNPPRFNQWYGFGRGEQMEYRVDGNTLTTSEYVSTLSSVLVTPISVSGTVQSGPVTFSRGAGNLAAYGMWLYDSQLQPLFDGGCQGGATITRTLAPGTYYMAVSDGNTANNLGTPADSISRSQNLLGYPDSIASSSAAAAQNLNMKLAHAGGTTNAIGTKSGAYDIVWYAFTVTDGPTVENCCRGTTCNSVNAGTCTGTAAGSASLVVGACGAGTSLATCCYSDFNHDGIVSIDDLFLYFNAYFTSSPWANVGGDGVVQPTIDDLFLYINAYFVGCQ